MNRAHILIEPTLAEADMATVKVEWGVADSADGHGTRMAGLALFGDLTPHLAGTEVPSLTHRLESVKILPPDGFDPTEERLYGAFTKQAVALPESKRPDRRRVFCLAVTNKDRTGNRPTTWSAAIDQEAAGVTEVGNRAPPRLFLVSAGNAPNEITMDQIADPDTLEIEDPAQAWNAITVGGYTDLINIQETGFQGYSPYASAGDISPYTRTSTLWIQGKAPFKPDIVMEAGNRVVSPARTDAYDVDSLALLSTGPNTDQNPLMPFRATSAATAQAARLAARLTAEFPHYWPETIRALMIHAAEWTPLMNDALKTAGTKSKACLLLRRYGHGVPTFERAAASARNHLAIVSQAEIQPYSRSGKGMNECHFYSLPWPRVALETLGEQDVTLKITLSYFVEPNPGASAAFDPYRYQSYGLRFELKRRSETVTDFAKRLNKQAWEKPKDRPSTDEDRDKWLFGTQSMSAGSLHSDEWTGPAINLLSRNNHFEHGYDPVQFAAAGDRWEDGQWLEQLTTISRPMWRRRWPCHRARQGGQSTGTDRDRLLQLRADAHTGERCYLFEDGGGHTEPYSGCVVLYISGGWIMVQIDFGQESAARLLRLIRGTSTMAGGGLPAGGVVLGRLPGIAGRLGAAGGSS